MGQADRYRITASHYHCPAGNAIHPSFQLQQAVQLPVDALLGPVCQPRLRHVLLDLACVVADAFAGELPGFCLFLADRS
jgi:hypothetical protein